MPDNTIIECITGTVVILPVKNELLLSKVVYVASKGSKPLDMYKIGGSAPCT